MQGRTNDKNLRRAGGSMAAAAARRMSAALLVGVLAMSGRAHAQAPTGNVDRVKVSRIHASVQVDTGYDDDRLVPNGGNSQCSIQLDGPYTGDNDVDVTLSEDNATGGRVSIDEPMDFTLPANKTAVPFALMGVIDSEAVDDVLLTVKDPENLWAGEAKATVYDLVSPQIDLTPQGNYVFDGRTLRDPVPAMKINGSVTVVPPGATGARLQHTMVGICQNGWGEYYGLLQHHWKRWFPSPNSGEFPPKGTKAPVPSTAETTWDVPKGTVDINFNGRTRRGSPIMTYDAGPPCVEALSTRDAHGVVTCSCDDTPTMPAADVWFKSRAPAPDGAYFTLLETYLAGTMGLLRISAEWSDFLVTWEDDTPAGYRSLAEGKWGVWVNSRDIMNGVGQGKLYPAQLDPPMTAPAADVVQVTASFVFNDYLVQKPPIKWGPLAWETYDGGPFIWDGMQ